MRNLFLLTFLVLITTNNFAQEERMRKFGIAIVGSAELNGGIFKDHLVKTKPGFGYGFGIDAHFSMSKHLLLRIGVNLAQRNYQSVVDSVTLPSWTTQPNPYGKMRSKMNYGELAIPLQFHYRFSKPFFVGGGIEIVLPAIYSQNGVRLEHEDFTIEQFNSSYEVGSNMAITISGGYKYEFGREMSLLIEPTFKVHMNPIPFASNKDFFSFGLKCSLRWGAH